MTPLVEARGLHATVGTTRALQGVSLALHPGEAVAVTGPSGSGKSTLLHCLAGLLRPDQGVVTVDGVDLRTLGDRERSRLRLERMGFVPQFGDFVPELTLRENVELPLRLLGRGRRAARARARELLERLGVDEVADRRAGEASGGQVQRAAVARALAHEPVLVLADEPTGSLDTLAGEQVLEALLEHAAAAGAALLVVTHEARVAAYADRDVVLRDGRLRGGSVGATA